MLAEPQTHNAPKIATTIRHLNGLHNVAYRNPEHVYSAIERHFGVCRVDLLSGRRNAQTVKARHWGMYLMKTQWGMSYPYVGRLFGDRDHTTIINGVKKVTAEIATSEDARRTEVDLVAALQRAEGGDEAIPETDRSQAPDIAPLSERRAAKARDAVDQHFAEIDPDQALTPGELRAKLDALVRRAGFETGLAAKLGVSNQLLNHIRNGRQEIGRKMAEALGYERRVSYVPLRRAAR